MVMPISEEMVLNTIQDIDEFDFDKVEKEMEKLGKSQPDLLNFVFSTTDELGDDAKEMGIYTFFVLYKMFTKAYGRIGKATFKEIEESYEHNLSVLEQLDGADENKVLEIAEKQAEKQPNVYKYIAQTLLLQDDEEDLQISPEDRGFLFVVFMTVINILDKKISKSIEA